MLLIVGVSVFFISCGKDHTTTAYTLDVRSSFPAMDISTENPLTEEAIDLGRKLFYDVRLSVDSTISCGSCHKAEFAFAENKALSLGVEDRLGNRNSPTLSNIGYAPHFNYDGGVRKLEIQPNVPIEAENEMDFHMLRIQDRLKDDPDYKRMSTAAYDRSLDPYVISRSIASFLRTFISDDSRYDQYFYDQEDVLTREEKAGMELFFGSKAQCATCHSGFNFTDYTFRNNGYKTSFTDLGRYAITLDTADNYLYRVPTLRNIELTAPYMHDGSVSTLTEVLASYAQGGHAPHLQDDIISGISLTSAEQASIIAFLKTLTDESFINNVDLQKR